MVGSLLILMKALLDSPADLLRLSSLMPQLAAFEADPLNNTPYTGSLLLLVLARA